MSEEFDAKAREIVEKHTHFAEWYQGIHDDLMAAISSALLSAVKREREECWKIASARWQEAYAELLKAVTDDGKLIFDASQATASNIASSIRARGNSNDK
jgi:hemoglobin-like flavoprotein